MAASRIGYQILELIGSYTRLNKDIMSLEQSNKSGHSD